MNTNDQHSKRFRRSPCPVANTLEIIGDKWTLLVVRDLLIVSEQMTYGDFLLSPERIPTNILADRLKRLEHHGLIDKTPYQQRPVRYAYSLTDKGKELSVVLTAMKDWGLKHIAGTKTGLTPKKQPTEAPITADHD